MKKGIYKLNFDCGRSGELTGIFVSTDKKVEKLIESGIQVYFGEVLGKHSDVCGPIEKNDIKLHTDDAEAVEAFEKYDFESGYNPFGYSNPKFEQEEDETNEMETIDEVIDYLLSK